MTDVTLQPTLLDNSSIPNRALIEQNEMAAFEKGRMQGEMEAIRRMEQETQLKTFPVTTVGAEPAALNVVHPDVLEINRLTYMQRFAAILGELSITATVVLTIAWIKINHGGFDWSYDDFSIGTWNTHMLCLSLGLWFHSQAILLYRVLPLNLNPWLNRALYIFNYSCAITCYIVGLVGRVRSTPEMRFWAVDDWCLALGLAVACIHGCYSMLRVFIEPMRPVEYEKWAELNNKLTWGSPEQHRDRSVLNQAGRTIYTPAPLFPSGSAVPPANANVGAEVPVAPVNAPRWAENPNTHAENYFLLPRAKWAVCGFVAMGAAFLMTLSAYEHIITTDHQNWSQDVAIPGYAASENSGHAWLVGSLGVVTLAAVLMIAYAAMPPRTTLVKNGILVDQSRRASISHNAETRVGNIV